MPEVVNNSDAARKATDQKEPEHVMERPKGFFGRILERFSFGSFEEAREAVIDEVIIPTLLDGLRDCIYTLTDHILYGGNVNSSHRRHGKKGGYTAYSKEGQKRSGSKKVAPASGGYYFTFDTRQEADEVLDRMRDVIDVQDSVTIMEMFAIAKRQTSNFTYTNWGWYDLSRAMTRRAYDGKYYIELPKPVMIED